MKGAGLFLIFALVLATIGALEMGIAVKTVIMKGELLMIGGLHILAALLAGAIATYNL